MNFNKTTPDTERAILVLFDAGEGENLVKGKYYEDEEDFYDFDGEMLDGVIAWAEMPEIEFED